MDNAGHFCYNAVKSVKVTSGAEQKIGRKKTVQSNSLIVLHLLVSSGNKRKLVQTIA